MMRYRGRIRTHTHYILFSILSYQLFWYKHCTFVWLSNPNWESRTLSRLGARLWNDFNGTFLTVLEMGGEAIDGAHFIKGVQSSMTSTSRAGVIKGRWGFLYVNKTEGWEWCENGESCPDHRHQLTRGWGQTEGRFQWGHTSQIWTLLHKTSIWIILGRICFQQWLNLVRISYTLTLTYVDDLLS